MKKLTKPQSSMVYQLRHLEDGLLKDELKHNEQTAGITYTSALENHQQNRNNKKYVEEGLSMLGSRLKSNCQIFKTRNYLSKKISQNIQLSKISDPALILKEKVSKKFLNCFSMDLLKKLSLPIEIDSQESDLNSSNGYLKSSTLHSEAWIPQNQTNKTFHMSCLKSLLTTLHPITEKESIKKEKKAAVKTTRKRKTKKTPTTTEEPTEILEKKSTATTTKKIRFYPTSSQKAMIKLNLKAATLLYNYTIDVLNEKFKEKREKYFNNENKCVFVSDAQERCMKETMKGKIVCFEHRYKDVWDLSDCKPEEFRDNTPYKGNNIKEGWEWTLDVLDDIKGEAICQAVVDYQINLRKMAKFEMVPGERTVYKFRGRNIKRVEKEDKYYFTNKLVKTDKYIHFRHQERMKPLKEVNYYNIQKDLNKYYILLHEERPIEENNLQGIVALDPGVRKFQSSYDDTGKIIHFGGKAFQKLIKKKFKKIDNLHKLSTDKVNFNYKTRYSMKKKIVKLHQDVRGLINDLHNQVASFLTRTYNIIFLPEFNTQNMKKDLPPPVNRMLDVLSHYKFKMKLEAMAMRRNSHLYIVDEFLTTKTCGECGYVNNVEKKETWKCIKCKYSHERDDNSARNILLRALTMMIY